MSFYDECRKCGKRLVAGACVLCGVAVGAPTVAGQQSAGGAATTMSVTLADHPWLSPAGHPPGRHGDSGDLPDPGEPAVTYDGPFASYSATATTVRVTPPAPHDD